MNNEITREMLEGFARDLASDRHSAAAMRAVMKNGINACAENQKEQAENPMTFSIEIETGKITNQKHSGRCWLFAALNVMRFHVMKNLDLETFELSQNYQMFYDKLEKANYFLNSIALTADEDVSSRIVSHLLSSPEGDGGQWDMYCALADKYGCVPKSVMPETFHSSETRQLVQILTWKLRGFAKELRDAVRAGQDTQDMRRRMLSEVYRILALCLGEPPKSFDFEWRDRSKEYHRDANITPTEFFAKYVRVPLSEYVSVINAPTQDKPYRRMFTVDHLGNVIGGREVRYLNLPADEQKALAVAQLRDGEPVWFGCDVGKYSLRDYGIMGMHTYEYEDLLGVDFTLDKAGRLDYGQSLMTHAMVFLGVNIVDGKPNRWKVENSWGEDAGQKGYYIMTDEWFDQYNYQVVVNRKYLSDEQRAMLAQEPIHLKPWDPMGSLA